MQFYPFNHAIILNNSGFIEYGGLTGTFSNSQLLSSYWLAEMQVTNYIGAPLLPVVVSGTYAFEGVQRIPTDYGYVHRLIAVNILGQNSFSTTCDLKSTPGCGFIYNDTFGYIDIRQVMSACNIGYAGYWSIPYPVFPPTYPPMYNFSNPYQIEIVYETGLPTGTANQPGIMEALAILAQIDLNEKSPGLVDVNEGVGDIGIQSFRSIDYAETRGAHSLVKTALGESAQAMRAKRLIDMSVKKARRSLRIG